MKKFSYSTVSLGPLWCLGAALILSLCWLLPNNARPWTSFHSDAWAACILALVSLAVLVRGGKTIEVHLVPLVVLALGMLPLAQYGLGQLPFSGQAWISSAYLLGFALALVTGGQWHKFSPLWMERMLFGAFLVAGVISVCMALHQWLRLGESATMFDIWILPYPPDQRRPYANFAQPNQLATLLVWALVACAWTIHRGYLQMVGGIGVAGFLLIGLALTQSRSGMVCVLVLLSACYLWRHLVNSRIFFRCVAGLALWYVVLLLMLPSLGQLLLLDTEINFIDRSAGESRPYMWRMLLDAATLQPWAGYGWNQVLPAQMAVSESYPGLWGTYLAQSHNLFLDFVIWAGFPAGLLLTAVILAWFWVACRRLQYASQALYLVALAVIGAHSMVELPLHYAYFLLPAGLMAGALNASMKIWSLGFLDRRVLLFFWCAAASLLGLIINDYFRLESAFNDIRFEKANFVNAPKQHIPNTLVLNHLQYFVELYAMTPAAGMPVEDVRRAIDSTTFLPSAYNISKLVVILALNKQPDAAHFWMRKAKSMMSPENYMNAQKDWLRAATQFPEIAGTLRIQD
ncbi:MAG: Wzy polymerase domain-containing protein [Pseudomonadota bacterium]